MAISLKNLCFNIWKSKTDRKGIRQSFIPVCTRYIGVEDNSNYANILATILDKVEHCKYSVMFDGTIPMQVDFDIITYVGKELESMNISDLDKADIVMFNDTEFNTIFLSALNQIFQLVFCKNPNGDFDLDLIKKRPSLKNVMIGCGWNPSKDANTFDLDISAFLLDENGKVNKPSTDVVFFNMPSQDGISLDGDNLTDSGGDGDKECISVILDQIRPEIKEIIINVNIFDAVKKQQVFGMIKNSYIRLVDQDSDNEELCRFELREDASQSTAIVFAKLVRNDNGWSFEAIGKGYVVEDLNQLLKIYM